MMKKNILWVPIATLAILGLIGCSKTNPTSTNTTPAARPKIGSTFTYDVYNKNTDHTIDTSSRTSVTFTLVDTAFVASPISNIYRYTGTNGSEIDAHYETNGDFSLYVGFQVQGQTVFTEWVTLPVTSHTPVNPPMLQVTSPAPGIVMTTLAYNGSDTTRVGTTTLPTIKASADYVGIFQTPAADTVTGPTTYQYSSQLEMFAKTDLTVYGTLGGTDLNGGQYQVLRSYMIK